MSQLETRPGWIDKLYFLLWRPWLGLLALVFLATPSSFLIAGTRAGAAFLKIDTGARPAAMGGAYTALADDVNAIYYNPGGLANLTKREIGATHSQWLFDSKFDFVGYAQPSKFGTFGLGITRLTNGAKTGRDAQRQATSSYDASDTSYSIGLSRDLGPDGLGAVVGRGSSSLGANMKYLHSTIGPYSASALAFDLGAVRRFRDRPLSLGLSLLNIGRGMQYLDQVDPLPLTVSGGAAYRFGGLLQLALDVRHEVYDNRTDVGLGTEYAILPNFSLRMGYGSAMAQTIGRGGLASFDGVSGGFGIKLSNYRADYTFSPFGQLGNVQRLSLGARF